MENTSTLETQLEKFLNSTSLNQLLMKSTSLDQTILVGGLTAIEIGFNLINYIDTTMNLTYAEKQERMNHILSGISQQLEFIQQLSRHFTKLTYTSEFKDEPSQQSGIVNKTNFTVDCERAMSKIKAVLESNTCSFQVGIEPYFHVQNSSKKPFLAYDKLVEPTIIQQLVLTDSKQDEARFFQSIYQIAETWLFVVGKVLAEANDLSELKQFRRASLRIVDCSRVLQFLSWHNAISEKMIDQDFLQLKEIIQLETYQKMSHNLQNSIECAKQLWTPFITVIEARCAPLLKVFQQPHTFGDYYAYAESLWEIERSLQTFINTQELIESKKWGVPTIQPNGLNLFTEMTKVREEHHSLIHQQILKPETIMKDSRCKPKTVFILSAPRSFSTLIWRIFSVHPNIDSYCEPITESYYFEEGDTKVTRHNKNLKMLNIFQENQRLGRHTVVKEISHIMRDPDTENDYYFDSIYKGQFTHLVYLLRNPASSVRSYTKITNKLNDPTFQVKKEFGFQDLHQLYQKHKGHIFVSDELLINPQKCLKELFDYLEIDFEPIRDLKWEPMNNREFPEEYYPWCEDIMRSTCIQKRDHIEKVEDSHEDPFIDEVIKHNQVFYQKMLEEYRNQMEQKQ